jgi:hypothetical protein
VDVARIVLFKERIAFVIQNDNLHERNLTAVPGLLTPVDACESFWIS